MTTSLLPLPCAAPSARAESVLTAIWTRVFVTVMHTLLALACLIFLFGERWSARGWQAPLSSHLQAHWVDHHNEESAPSAGFDEEAKLLLYETQYEVDQCDPS
jgi:hypothetical protein